MARSKRGHNARTQARNSRGQFCSEPRVRFIYSDSESDYDSNLVTPAPTLTMAKTKKKKSKVQRTRELIIIDSDSDDKVKTTKKVCKGEASTPTKKIYTGKAPIASEEEVNDSWYTDSSSQYSDYIQSEDGPTEGALVKALVEEAKADAKAAIDHYAKKANKEVDQVFDNLYYDIKDSVPLDDKKTTGRKK